MALKDRFAKRLFILDYNGFYFAKRMQVVVVKRGIDFHPAGIEKGKEDAIGDW